jgi:hypothetical protein
MYKFCRTHARTYKSYHHPNARAIPLSQVKDFIGPVRSIINLNLEKGSYKAACRFLTELVKGGVMSPNHEFAFILPALRQSTLFDQKEILIKLSAMTLCDLERNIFYAERHKLNQMGALFIKHHQINRGGVTTHRKVRRLYQGFGTILWENIGLFLLQVAKTAQKSMREQERHAQILAEPLDY